MIQDSRKMRAQNVVTNAGDAEDTKGNVASDVRSRKRKKGSRQRRQMTRLNAGKAAQIDADNASRNDVVGGNDNVVGRDVGGRGVDGNGVGGNGVDGNGVDRNGVDGNGVGGNDVVGNGVVGNGVECNLN